MNLLPHQLRILKDPRKKIGLFHECGTGKSATAIKWAESKGNDYLVITTKSVVFNWIKKEIPKWTDDVDKWTVISKETFRRDWDSLERYDVLVIDEAHYFFGYKSQMHKNLLKYIKKHDIKNVIALTGTPYLSSPFNLYACGKILGHDWNWFKFREKFFQKIRMGRMEIYQPRKNVKDEVIKWYHELGDFCKMSDIKDVPEHVYENEYFSVNKKQAKEIDNLIDLQPIVRYSKIFQIVNGTLKGDGYCEDKFIGGDKYDRALEAILSTEKLAVICRHTLELKSLYEAIRGQKKAFIVTGETKSEERDNIFKEVSSSDDCVIFLQSAISEGFTMQVPMIMFYSLDWSLKNYIQMLSRCVRMDNLQSIVYRHLIVSGTIDEDVYKSVVINKKDFHCELYAKT